MPVPSILHERFVFNLTRHYEGEGLSHNAKVAAEKVFGRVLDELTQLLYPYGFRRAGCSFRRDTGILWQMIVVRLSAGNSARDMTLQIGIGIGSKDALKVPPLGGGTHFDLGEVPSGKYAHLFGFRWTSVTDADFQAASGEIAMVFPKEVLPLLDHLSEFDSIRYGSPANEPAPQTAA